MSRRTAPERSTIFRPRLRILAALAVTALLTPTAGPAAEPPTVAERLADSLSALTDRLAAVDGAGEAKARLGTLSRELEELDRQAMDDGRKNREGQTTIPKALKGVTAIAGGGNHCLVLVKNAEDGP